MKKQESIIRINDLAELLTVSRTTIWEWRKEGKLPKPKKLGDKSIGWLESDIHEYLQNLPDAD